MAKIVISDLHHSDAKNFSHDLNPVQMDTIQGGSTPEILLATTIFDGVVKLLSNDSSLNTSDNQLFGVDFSNLAINFIVV